MFFKEIYPFIVVFLLNAVCIGNEYSIPVASQHFPECKSLHWRHHATNSAIEIEGVEIDIFLPSHNIGIEYDGFFWHKERLQSDIEKNEFFQKKGIQLIRVRDHPLQAISKSARQKNL